MAELVAESCNNQEIADQLGYSYRTVNLYLGRLYAWANIPGGSGGNRPKLVDALRAYFDQERMFG